MEPKKLNRVFSGVTHSEMVGIILTKFLLSENNQDNYFQLIDKSTYFEKLQIGFLLNNLSNSSGFGDFSLGISFEDQLQVRFSGILNNLIMNLSEINPSLNAAGTWPILLKVIIAATICSIVFGAGVYLDTIAQLDELEKL